MGLRLSRILSETNDKVDFCLGVYVISDERAIKKLQTKERFCQSQLQHKMILEGAKSERGQGERFP